MIYNQLVDTHNCLFEEITKTIIAPAGSDLTRYSSDKKMKKMDLGGRIKDIQQHLSSAGTGITQDRKDYLTNNLYKIDMIFDPMTPQERSLLVNLKAQDMLQKAMQKKEKSFGLESDIDDIIGFDQNDQSMFTDNVTKDVDRGDRDPTLTAVGSNRLPDEAGDEDTMWRFGEDEEEDNIYNDTTAVREVGLSRGSLIRNKYYGRY